MKRNSAPGILTGIVVLVLIFAVAVAAAEAPKWIGAFYVKGKVGLKWQESEGAVEYAVFRKTADSDFQKITTTAETRYFDIDLKPGAVYTYKLASIDAGGNEVFSGEKTVTIPGSQVGGFEPPTWVGVRIDQDKIYLNWDNVGSAIAYNIYRSTTAGADYDIVGNSQSSSFADNNNLEKGQTYFYVLTALNSEFDETEFSEERSIKFGMTLEEQQAAEAAQEKIELEDISLTLLFEITNAGSEGEMNQPADVFLNSMGNIYITDALHGMVHCFDNSGKYKFSFGEKTNSNDAEHPPEGTFGLPFTLFIDKQDQVYVGDVINHDIQVFSADGKFIKRIKVAVDEGQSELRPNGIYVLDDGRIIITDAGNHRFLFIDDNGKILLSKGTHGDKEGEFNFPDELTVTDDNTICIVDGINCRVQQFDLEGNFKNAFGSVGQSAGTFARPKAITVDESGRIWVSDAMSNLIQGFTPEGDVKAALGTTDDARFTTPRGIFIKDGRIYVVNRAINKVAVYRIG